MQAKNKQGVMRKRSRPNATVGCGFFYTICGGESARKGFAMYAAKAARKGLAMYAAKVRGRGLRRS